MKTLKIVICTIIICLLSVTSALAYKITTQNTTDVRLTVIIYGEHFFWRNQMDAECACDANGSVECKMPGLICPVKVKWNWDAFTTKDGVKIEKGSTYAFPAGYESAACWDTTYKAKISGDNKAIVFEVQ